MSEWIMSAEDIDDITGGRFTIGQKLVRCKDCEYYVETNGGIGTCELTISGAKDDGFCAWGERKDDGKNREDDL